MRRQREPVAGRAMPARNQVRGGVAAEFPPERPVDSSDKLRQLGHWSAVAHELLTELAGRTRESAKTTKQSGEAFHACMLAGVQSRKVPIRYGVSAKQ